MDIHISHEQARVPVTVLKVKGDLAAEEQLLSAAQEAHQNGSRHVLLDLSEVPFMSSAGLRALYNVYMLMREDDPAESNEVVRGGITSGTYTSPHVKLLNPTSHVSEVLKTAGYDMFLEIHRDYRDALASF